MVVVRPHPFNVSLNGTKIFTANESSSLSPYFIDTVLSLNTDLAYTLEFSIIQNKSVFGTHTQKENCEEGEFSLTIPESLTPAPVPLPGAVFLLGAGFGCLAIYRWRKMNTKN